MTPALISLGAALLYLWAFWAIYVMVMGLYRAHLAGRLTGLNRWLAAPFVLLGLGIDALANASIAWLVFLDPPREWLVTTRLVRYKATDTGWRARLAGAICEGLLDVFDPTGDHC